jgi:hydrogenase expression/formation protein HypC
MCLGIPGEIVEIDGLEARAEFWDVEKTVRLDIVGDQVEEGDYILNHVGYAIRKIPDEQVEETMELFESMLDRDRSDMLTDDVMDELETGRAVPAGEESAEDADAADDEDDLLEELDIDV